MTLDPDKPDQSFMEINNKARARPWKHGCGLNELRQPACENEARYCPKKHGGGIRLEEGTKGGVSIKPSIPLDAALVAMFIEHRKKQQAEHATAIKLGTIGTITIPGLVLGLLHV